MAVVDLKFQDICKEVFEKGSEYHNKRRNVNRLQIPSYTFKHSFKDGFPALTNKKLYMNGVTGELISFLRGYNDTKYLKDNKIDIWDGDACNFYNKENKCNLSKEEFSEKIKHYSVGQNYSVQWRNFNGYVDQIKELIDGMKKDIMSSRLIVNAWNPSELDKTALPPCHFGFQVVGIPLDNNKFGFELHWTQRSVDLFLG